MNVSAGPPGFGQKHLPRGQLPRAQVVPGRVGADGGNAAALRIHKAINRKLTDASAKGGSNAVLHVVSNEIARMNGLNLATALHRCARNCADNSEDNFSDDTASAEAAMEIQSHPIFNVVIEAVMERAKMALLPAGSRCAASADADYDDDDGALPAQCASIIVWSCATLHVRNLPLLQVLAEMACPCLREFKPYEVTNMLWAYAKLGAASACPEILRSSAAILRGRTKGDFKAQCLAVAVWSLSAAKWRDPDLFQSIAEELVGQVSTLKPQEISNILLAFAKQKLPHPALFEALGWAASGGPSGAFGGFCRFKPREMADTIWAFASAGLQHPALFAKFSPFVSRRSLDFSPQNLTRILWAYSKVGGKHREVAYKLLDAAAMNVQLYKPQELASVARSAGLLCPSHTRFFDCCVQSVCMFHEFPSRAIADLVEAFTLAAECGSVPRWALAAVMEEQQLRYSNQTLDAPFLLPEFFQPSKLASDDFFGSRTKSDISATTFAASTDTSDSNEDSEDNDSFWLSKGNRDAPLTGLDYQSSRSWAQPLARSSLRVPFPSLPSFVQLQAPPRPNAAAPRPPGLELPPGLESIVASPPPAHLHYAATLDSSALTLPTICLSEEEVDGEVPLEPGMLFAKASTGLYCGQFANVANLRLRHGMLDMRVIMCPVAVGFDAAISAVSPWQTSPNVLQPVALVTDGPWDTSFLAYPHCAFGNLGEYVQTRKAIGLPLDLVMSARVAQQVLLGAEALLEKDQFTPSTILGVMTPSSIFVDGDETIKVSGTYTWLPAKQGGNEDRIEVVLTNGGFWQGLGGAGPVAGDVLSAWLADVLPRYGGGQRPAPEHQQPGCGAASADLRGARRRRAAATGHAGLQGDWPHPRGRPRVPLHDWDLFRAAQPHPADGRSGHTEVQAAQREVPWEKEGDQGHASASSQMKRDSVAASAVQKMVAAT
eukprot:CAMPEP_0115076790 /NCGR_PEP_ID=MMETSP0227-20121206/16627_1 /TAXON_ID=89957 /ORGANISM="Polarella glacialis, Strain CCMP 1383" /LENGTH=943 /DNA_ID=CAMNT_0002463979 /DNA_START=110 /DNA_END=2939 /DNA_ORIENTATION=+